MPKFSQSSFSKLSTCHSDLQALFYEVIKYYDCTILEGYRNQEDQEKAFASGHTKLHWPNGKHNHQPSMAVDVTPYPIDFDNNKTAFWFGGYVMGIAQKLKDEGKITHSIRWGGAWDGINKFNTPGMLNDLVHFELIE
jgi:peptidoglycan LD-endopeptidase CwlK